MLASSLLPDEGSLFGAEDWPLAGAWHKHALVESGRVSIVSKERAWSGGGKSLQSHSLLESVG